MGTNKPRIQIILENEYYQKYKELCKRDDRSESKLGSKIIKSYIDQYEEIHGPIPTDWKDEK